MIVHQNRTVFSNKIRFSLQNHSMELKYYVPKSTNQFDTDHKLAIRSYSKLDRFTVVKCALTTIDQINDEVDED